MDSRGGPTTFSVLHFTLCNTMLHVAHSSILFQLALIPILFVTPQARTTSQKFIHFDITKRT